MHDQGEMKNPDGSSKTAVTEPDPLLVSAAAAARRASAGTSGKEAVKAPMVRGSSNPLYNI